MVQRLLTTGLCAAGLVMFATWPLLRAAWGPHDIAPGRRLPAAGVPFAEGAAARPERHAAVTVVDIAGGIAPAALPDLLRLAPDESVSAINDRAVATDLEAGAQIASAAPTPGEFLDLTVSGSTGERRVLVLRH